MRDLLIWDTLHRSDAATATLCEALALLCAADGIVREALSGPLPTLAQHSDAAVRVLVARALKTCTARVGRQALVRLMDDSDSAVRAQAVASAAESSHIVAIALFHRRLDVRSLALQTCARTPCAFPWTMAAHLLADDVMRPLVMACLDAQARQAATIAALLRAHALELLAPSDVCARVDALPWDDCTHTLSHVHPVVYVSERNVDSAKAIHEALQRSPRDALIDVLRLRSATTHDSGAVLAGLRAGVHNGKLAAPQHRRVALAVVADALAHGDTAPGALALAYAIAAGAVDVELPRATCVAALRLCVDVVPAQHLGRCKLATLPTHLLFDVAPGRQLDAMALAGALRLLESNPYAAVEGLHITDVDFGAALARTPKAAAHLVSLPAKTTSERAALAKLIETCARAQLAPEHLGAVLLALPAEGIGMLVQQHRDAAGAAGAIVPSAATWMRALSCALGSTTLDDAQLEVRVARAAAALAGRIQRPALIELLAELANQPLRGDDNPRATGWRATLIAVLLRAADAIAAGQLVERIASKRVAAFTTVLASALLPHRIEHAYASALKDSTDASARLWAHAVLVPMALAPRAAVPPEVQHLADASDDDVVKLVQAALGTATDGMAAVLLARATLPKSPALCAAALAMVDALPQVAALFQRAVIEEPAFLAQVHDALVRPDARADLPLLATAFVHHQAVHAARFAHAQRHTGALQLLQLAYELPSPVLTLSICRGVLLTLRQWAGGRQALIERSLDDSCAHFIVDVLCGRASPRPAVGGTRLVHSAAQLRHLCIDIAALAHRPALRGSCASFVTAFAHRLHTVQPMPDVRERLASLGHAWLAPTPPANAALRANPRDAFVELVAAGRGSEALALMCAASDDAWLMPDDVASLQSCVNKRAITLASATSPHAAAFTVSVYALDAMLHANSDDREAQHAMLRFLAVDDDRPALLRMLAAEALKRVGAPVPFLSVRLALLESSTTDAALLLAIDDATWDRVIASSAVTCGSLSSRLQDVISSATPPPDAIAARIARHLLIDYDVDEDNERTLFGVVRRARFVTDDTLLELVDTVRWGMSQARGLLGRPVTVELIHDAWGFTRLGEPRVHINPMPILKGERDGAHIVRGLLVHEIGHQVFHADEAALVVWKQANTAKLGSLLNLVADEHLERKLRSQSDVYGDALKRLCAHAFAHANKDVALLQLVATLGRRAFAVVLQLRLLPARQTDQVTVEVGKTLHAVAGSGGSFAKFVRALRMGLGTRDSDEKVAAALALFAKASFKDSSMAQLYTTTQELARIFGDEVQLLNAVGMHEVMESQERDLRAEGLSPDELRALGQRTGPVGGRPVFNNGSDEAFDDITDIVALPHDAVAHRAVATLAQRGAALLRSALLDLGMRAVVQRRRLSGRSVDRAGLGSAISKRDPRILRRRVDTPAPDLFIGVAVDCSGSMQAENRIETARVFATLIAQAAHDVPGVDVRIIGFTDKTLFDAGTQKRCAAHALMPGGGNNDAAGLWYAATLAKLSKRRDRLLVMISDGLPTECSIGALRALVQRLTRSGILCAQVAVRPIEEHVFNDYVEILDGDNGAAARKFARVVTTLVKRAAR